jgi:arginine exporter protein ArgO
MKLSRRTWFFLAMSAACLLLLAPTPEKYRWVNLSMGALSLMWFVLLAVEEILARRGESRPRAGRSHR